MTTQHTIMINNVVYSRDTLHLSYDTITEVQKQQTIDEKILFIKSELYVIYSNVEKLLSVYPQVDAGYGQLEKIKKLLKLDLNNFNNLNLNDHRERRIFHFLNGTFKGIFTL